MSASAEMPKYQSIKKVSALKMKELYVKDGIWKFTPEEEGYADIVLDSRYMEKHTPKIGGYYIVYKGGYKSWSPADAFEEGNKRI